MFDLSPPGHGVDCYRTWESLALGMVPIVLAGTSLDAGGLYDGLPVIRVRNFSEVNPQSLRRWVREIGRKVRLARKASIRLPDGSRVVVLERLTSKFWVRKMREATRRKSKTIFLPPPE